jgi:hypothetical protein
MSLKLGKSFNRSYNLRLPILDGYYNIGLYFDKKSTFLLFRVDPDFSHSSFKRNIKINMFKNLEQSKFCETFIGLHNYRKNTLDISNQFDKIRDDYTHDISLVLNESIVLSKVELYDKDVFDTLNIYGFTINSYIEEFIFIIAERHNVLKRLGKKIVRTSGLQISTTPALDMLDEYCIEQKSTTTEARDGFIVHGSPDKVIKLSEAEKEAKDESV